MGNPSMDGTDGMPDFGGGEKGMGEVYRSFLRKEYDPNRKVERKDHYKRYQGETPSSDGAA